jgi:hypothetical protein
MHGADEGNHAPVRDEWFFRSSPSGRMVAAARFNMSGCGGMGLTVAGVEQALNISSDTFAGRVLRIAGIRVPAIAVPRNTVTPRG